VPDTQILAAGSASAPEAYTVPNAQEIMVKAVACTLDGTGASGDFLPMLSIIPPGGVGAIECPMLTTVAAGESAEVSWFPGGIASTPPSLNIPQIVYLGNWNAPAGTGDAEPGDGELTYTEAENFYPDVFTIDTGTPTANSPQILQPGYYWWDAVWNAFTNSSKTVVSPVADDLTLTFGGGQFMVDPFSGLTPLFPTYTNGYGYATGVFNVNTGQDMELIAANTGGADIYVNLALRIAKLDDNTGVS
jgi:hypothetical protein